MQSFAQTFIWVMMADLRGPVLLPLRTQKTPVMRLRSSMATTGKAVCSKSAKTALLVLQAEDTAVAVSEVASAAVEASAVEAALDVGVSEVDMGAVEDTVAAMAVLLQQLGMAPALLPRLRQTRLPTLLHPVVSAVKPFTSAM